LNNPWKIIW